MKVYVQPVGEVARNIYNRHFVCFKNGEYDWLLFDAMFESTKVTWEVDGDFTIVKINLPTYPKMLQLGVDKFKTEFWGVTKKHPNDTKNLTCAINTALARAVYKAVEYCIKSNNGKKFFTKNHMNSTVGSNILFVEG